MYSKIQTAALNGIGSLPIIAEVDLSSGLPVFDMVGNISVQVREGKERIRTSLHNLGISLPAKRITINLSPANVRKDSASFDLPIAVGILCVLGLIPEKLTKDTLFIGELNLSGELLPVDGVLPIVSDAKSRGIGRIVVPNENRTEAQLVEDVEVFSFGTLLDVMEFYQGKPYEEKVNEKTVFKKEELFDFADVNGQPFLRRVAEVSACGMHNLLLIGPPGAGKTMVAERMPSILPPLNPKEQLEISKIYSIKGLLRGEHGLLEKRPFRNPHHTISKIGLTGGGSKLEPGEISLAHTGVLFLDELTEFEKDTVEILRQPLENHKIVVTRQQGTVEYPADFLLLAAMNPCNCGYYPNLKLCRCTPNMRRRYYEKISQPLLDRIDLFVRAEPLSFADLTKKQVNESSEAIRNRVLACQQIQSLRYREEPFYHNSQIPASKIKQYCHLSNEDEDYMESMFEKHHFTGRTYHKLLRVARTIADMDNKEQIARAHLMEALCYRNPEEFLMGEEL